MYDYFLVTIIIYISLYNENTSQNYPKTQLHILVNLHGQTWLQKIYSCNLLFNKKCPIYAILCYEQYCCRRFLLS